MMVRIDSMRSKIQQLVDNLMSPTVKAAKGTVVESDIVAARDALQQAIDHLTDAIAKMVEARKQRNQ
jgi:t-SNARE complex subunit (syntaxin)